MIEDWLCNNGGLDPSQTPHVSASVPDLPQSSRSSRHSASIKAQTGKGMYHLLTKERLMGIYTAVFIHREVRPQLLHSFGLCAYCYNLGETFCARTFEGYDPLSFA